MNGLVNVAHKRSWLPFHRTLPGSALLPRTASVSWDGYVSYDGVLYGVPSQPPVAGSVVQVREWRERIRIWHMGQLLVEWAKRPHSQTHVDHPDQWKGVAPAASRRALVAPIGHQRAAPQVEIRPLSDYDQFCGVEVKVCSLN
jgi:hypothetical protein